MLYRETIKEKDARDRKGRTSRASLQGGYLLLVELPAVKFHKVVAIACKHEI